jgi:hypothetical protein
VSRLEDSSPQKEVQQTILQVRIELSSSANNQTRRVFINWVKNKAPAFFEDDSLARFYRQNAQRGRFREKPHFVAHF